MSMMRLLGLLLLWGCVNPLFAQEAAFIANEPAKNQVYNVALGDRTTLNTLFNSLKTSLNNNGVKYNNTPEYQEFRAGDVRHSQADISKAQSLLGYEPEFRIGQGIEKAMPWYIDFIAKV